ncbi:MAG: radical SAM protein, partial [Thermodesulfobacteriota bacterium]
MTTPQATTLEFKPGERNIFFHLLTACNLSCRHCYINPTQHGAAQVSRATMEEWLRLFHEPAKETNVIFLGGEPTMHPDLAHGIRYARKLGYETVTVDSNGYLFHNLLDEIAPDEAVISFSLDGPDAATNDAIRGQGVFATCTNGIKEAVAKGFDVSLIYTVSRMNLRQLAQMVPLLEELGVRRFFIQVIGIRGKSATDSGQLQLSPEEWLEIVPAVAAQAARAGIHVIYPKVFLEEGEKFACGGLATENFFVFPNGRVYQCPLCEDFPVHSYEIIDNRLKQRQGLTEENFFGLTIKEGCVMNKLLQGDNIDYNDDGSPVHRISCCLLKQE